MLMRTVLIAAAVSLIAGCSSTPQVESRSYALKNRATEEALIKAQLDDEAERLGAERLHKMVERSGGELEALKVTDDGTAIVRTTPRGHREIKRALSRAQRDAAARRQGVGQ